MSLKVFHIFEWRKTLKVFLLTFLFFMVSLPASLRAQVVLTGRVIDQVTGEPIPFAAVGIVDKEEGTLTDTNGYFRLKTLTPKGVLGVSAMGYDKNFSNFRNSHNFNIVMKQSKSKLGEVTVRSKRRNYKNKGNPAVALIREVIKHKEENRPAAYPFVQYREYEKTTLSSGNTFKFLQKNIFVKKYQFFFQNIDTVSLPGKKLIPVFIEENEYRKYLRKQPQEEHSVLVATKRVNLNDRYVNNESLSKVLDFLYQSVDVYDNNIFLLTNEFISPLSPLSPQFFRFYITDTVTNTEGQKIVKMSFEPRNSHDMSFFGSLQIALNGHYSIVAASLFLPRVANVNWVKTFSINVRYAPDDAGRYFLQESNTKIELGMGAGVKQTIFGERTAIVDQYDNQSEIPDSIFHTTAPDSLRKRNEYWAKSRPEQLSAFETRTYANVDSLNSMKSFKRLTSWVSFLAGGYKNVGIVEIGRWDKVYSFNPVRGQILRVGARSTEEFSHSFYWEGNLGYGFRDKRFSYLGSLYYVFNKQNPFWGYPQHYVQISAVSDTRIPGRGFSLSDERNLFLSLKRGENSRYFYNQLLSFNYVNELIPHLRTDAYVERWGQEAAGSLVLLAGDGSGGLDTIKKLTISGFGLNVRWSPKEEFMVGRRQNRNYIPSRYPIVEAFFKTGVKGFVDGEYDYQKLELSVKKRFYLSRLGMADVNLQGGYLFGKVPYPLLFVPAANQSYEYQATSFNLMNYMEFMSDRYASLTIDYHMKGLLLNNIPLIKWLRLREVAGFRAVYGGLRPENAAILNSALFQNEDGLATTYNYGSVPYMEASVGLENIFNVFRVVYVRRLNYYNHPGISLNGVRVGLKFYF